MKLAAALFLTLNALAQVTPRIAGIVLEQGLNTPIAGAEVALYEIAETEVPPVGKLSSTVLTDARGAYSFQPTHIGVFRIEVKKPGYFSTATGPAQSEVSKLTVVLRPDRQRVEGMTILLMNPGSLTGRVVDEDGKPIANQDVIIQGAGVANTFPAGFSVPTSDEGLFIASPLPPGAYIVRIAPTFAKDLTILDYDEAAFKVVDNGIESSFWPGGLPDSGTVIPIRVLPGSSADVGTVKVRKSSYYRAHVEFKGDCSASEQWHFAILHLPYDNTRPQENRNTTKTCANHFLIRDLAPGSYMLAAWTGTENIRWAQTPFSITSANIEVPINLASSADITARVVAPEGVAPASLSNLRIEMRAEGAPPAGTQYTFMQGSEGQFSIRNLPWSRHAIRIVGLPRTHYVKEIRYAGQPVSDQVLNIAPGGQLDIVIDDKPASITGTVKSGTARELRLELTVVLLSRQSSRGGSPQNDPFSDFSPVNPVGNFQFFGLAPGAYRIQAFSAEALAGRLNDLAAEGGDLVTIGVGELKTIEIKLQ